MENKIRVKLHEDNIGFKTTFYEHTLIGFFKKFLSVIKAKEIFIEDDIKINENDSYYIIKIKKGGNNEKK